MLTPTQAHTIEMFVEEHGDKVQFQVAKVLHMFGCLRDIEEYYINALEVVVACVYGGKCDLPYVLRAVYYRTIDSMRSNRVRFVAPLREASINHEDWVDVNDFLNHVCDPYEELIVKLRLQGYTQREIAEKLDECPTTIHRRLTDIRRKYVKLSDEG